MCSPPAYATSATTYAMRSNGEVEGPHDSARLEPRVHTVCQHARRHHRTSRHPPTIVRGRGHRRPSITRENCGRLKRDCSVWYADASYVPRTATEGWASGRSNARMI